jgi:hypothetical protein
VPGTTADGVLGSGAPLRPALPAGAGVRSDEPGITADGVLGRGAPFRPTLPAGAGAKLDVPGTTAEGVLGRGAPLRPGPAGAAAAAFGLPPPDDPVLRQFLPLVKHASRKMTTTSSTATPITISFTRKFCHHMRLRSCVPCFWKRCACSTQHHTRDKSVAAFL